MKNVIEIQILEAVKKLVSGRVNEIINDWQENLPVIEFGNYQSANVITPVIALVSCEKTEKDRIIRLDCYTLTISFSITDTDDNECNCYVMVAAIIRAFCEDPTLGGAVNRIEIIGAKYMHPKKQGYGESCDVSINVKITVEGIEV